VPGVQALRLLLCSLSLPKMRSLVALGLLGAAATVSAHPHEPLKENKAIRKRTVNLDSFRLKATAEYVDSAVVETKTNIKAIKRADYVGTATDLVKSIAPKAEFRLVEDHYVGDNGVAHVNFKQTVHGLDIDNADFNVNVSRESRRRKTALLRETRD